MALRAIGARSIPTTPIIGCQNKTFFKSSQVSPYRKFPYDQHIPHKNFQIILTIFKGPPRSLEFLYLDVKYITLYHTSVASFKLNNGSIYAKVVCLLPVKSS